MSALFRVVFTALVLTGSAVAAAPLPPDVSQAPWFAAHCRSLSADRVSHYPDVASHRITYAWQSDLGYLWEWENGARAADAADYCVRLALYGAKGKLIENVTMLCSVNARGTPTEVWMFGNVEIAARLCPMAAEQLKAMDAKLQRR
ncbi:MAG: hypothetical protein EPO08_15125 [Rhodospirillaceae bacterium]|nr:MAG: hypothetical protein EPO08_15125 [Rhodospirillaceae bacterium]